ncbi:probable LRR receptor-like serine/threonine-protein kinase At4g37250 [Ricinus communis]|uniref:non-specific serine/threonine protein kinase n=1 Tax=Ricinus communis TaxID=3988 RepID=B9SG04_RICCO|nr:probable LRR receptor-like serine/threonine-protein kinase At4g37250 [Ricinus communis]EEF37420.1 LIM domain kinase, putative [Ricinus communis]|eukprot:XP_002524923.1 probable LRR receptor-like serine/threonine-protein kinase At4g37250 [Ricinus communis]
MSSHQRVIVFHLWWKILALVLLLLVVQSFGLNTDGILLLSLKFSILSDPLRVLESWSYNDETPCSWNGVTCGGPGLDATSFSRVTGLSLPNSQLLGSIPADLGMIEHLQNLDLSNNSLNGSLPFSLFNATHLRFLDLSNNLISGELPETVGQLQNLEFLNLSDNAMAGTLHASLATLHNLTVISLKNNYFFGVLPGGFVSVQVLDLSSNLINGSLPQGFGGNSLHYLNISYNRLSGSIPQEFASQIPDNATIDLSFNNLTGEIPDSSIFLNQKITSYNGNPDLCGQPTRNPCPIPCSPSSLPNITSPTSPPAIAAIPKTLASAPATSPPSQETESEGLRKGTVIGIVLGDIAGVAILGMIFFYVYQFKKRKKNVETTTLKNQEANSTAKDHESWSSSSSESKGFTRWSCLRNKRGADNEDESDSTSSDDNNDNDHPKVQENNQEHREQSSKGGTLVTVDGEKELELETLLKASAYILGATGSSIMYKAVLEDGTSLAVRRIGENHVERFRDFETQVRVIAKLVHPNLVRIRGFYWGADEKLIIYDFVPNGSLASARYRKVGSSPCHLPWEARLKIAKGVARGLSYLHDKKQVHGNLKPSNILLGSDMEPRIGDFGLERLVTGDSSSKAGGSTRNFGSKRSSASRDSFQEFSIGPSPSPSPSPSLIGGLSPYHAPESLRSLKPNPKWDVFSFGVILLELLTGKVIVVDELGQGSNGITVDDKSRAIRMADVAIRADVEGKEEALLPCFKVGYSCASPVPQKRPTMKEILQVLEKIPSKSSSYMYGH